MSDQNLPPKKRMSFRNSAPPGIATIFHNDDTNNQVDNNSNINHNNNNNQAIGNHQQHNHQQQSLHNPSHWSANGEQLQPVDMSINKSIQGDVAAYASIDRLKAHAKRQYIKDSRKYQCHQCLKSFVQKSSLTTHLRIHTGEKPLVCDYCDASFGDASTHKKHIRTHTKEKPYSCRHCNKAFSQSGNCLRHERQIHGHKA